MISAFFGSSYLLHAAMGTTLPGAGTQAPAGGPGRANLPPELTLHTSHVLFLDSRYHLTCHLLIQMGSWSEKVSMSNCSWMDQWNRILFLLCSWLHTIITVIFQKFLESLPLGQKFWLAHYFGSYELDWIFFIYILFSVIPSFLSCSPSYSPCLSDSDTLAHVFWNVLPTSWFLCRSSDCKSFKAQLQCCVFHNPFSNHSTT